MLDDMENSANEDVELKLDDLSDFNFDDIEINDGGEISEPVVENHQDEDNVFDDLVETIKVENQQEKEDATQKKDEIADDNSVAVSDDLTDAEVAETSVRTEEFIEENNVENNVLIDKQSETLVEPSNHLYVPQESGREVNFINWYSGASDEAIFEVSKTSESGLLEGDDEWKIIHVNVGYDTYGWNVEFDSGTVMNLSDVREYQLRNGSLPSANGRIIYGATVIDFRNIEKITIYQSVRYFTYG
ncbi:MAG: hypothetical protein E7012_03800 [Alphaproteobacteria bacterium]|nr:hypothetical protein [Alphaproteobacteria bacterium]